MKSKRKQIISVLCTAVLLLSAFWCVWDSYHYRIRSDETVKAEIEDIYSHLDFLTNPRIESLTGITWDGYENASFFGIPLPFRIARTMQSYTYVLSADEFSGFYYIGTYCPQKTVGSAYFQEEIHSYLSELTLYEQNKNLISSDSLFYYSQEISETVVNGAPGTIRNGFYCLLSEGESDTELFSYINENETVSENDHYVIWRYHVFDRNLFEHIPFWKLNGVIDRGSYNDYFSSVYQNMLVQQGRKGEKQ